MNPQFGHTIHMLAFAATGILGKSEAEAFTCNLIQAIGMREGPGASTFDYGDIGFVHVRTLMESMITVDSWYPKIEGCYITVESCKQFSKEQVKACVEAHGLEMYGDAIEGVLRLP